MTGRRQCVFKVVTEPSDHGFILFEKKKCIFGYFYYIKDVLWVLRYISKTYERMRLYYENYCRFYDVTDLLFGSSINLH